MRWLSESVELLIADELVDEQGKDLVHDVVVIGSGYGGAVSALRLAEKGRRVLVLERGEEYLPGEFPNDSANLPSHVRVERWNDVQPVGYESSLFDLRVGENTGVLVGNALGGTSQINASTAVRPDRRVFQSPRWPKALREDPDLDAFYATAERTLGLETFQGIWSEPKSRWVPVAKHAALRALSDSLATQCGSKLAVTFEPAPLTVKLCAPEVKGGGVATSHCIGCGDCVTGCNHASKKTLSATYLAEARKHGARFFTGASVLEIGRTDDADPWKITFLRTAERAQYRKLARTERKVLTHALLARTVILAAGTLGSTELLHRSARAGLSVSSRLGCQFSGNGDYLAFGYMQDAHVDGVGRGARWRTPGGAVPVGPTITGMIRVDDPEALHRSTVIEEGSVPGAIAGIFHELATTLATVSQLTEKSYRGEDKKHPPVDPLALQAEALTHTQTLLAMGHDSAGGILGFDADKDRLRIEWPGLADEAVYALHDKRLREVERLGAIYLQNPAWSPLPASVGDVLSGPKLGKGMFTVHPLGGCPMGESAQDGVVDDSGAVYRKEGGKHAGLYVLDGSIIPCALGINPLLTITALAERAIDAIASRLQGPAAPAAPSALPEYPGTPKPYANPEGERLALQFTEVLRGEVNVSRELDGEKPGPQRASLLLHLPVVDLKRFFESTSHRIEILGVRGGDKERLPACFTLGQLKFEVVSGSVEIFESGRPAGLRKLAAFVRVTLTWLIERGWDEIRRQIRQRISRRDDNPGFSLRKYLHDWLRLARHATESRSFRYKLNLQRNGESYYLQGTKHFEYAASWRALGAYLREWHPNPLKRGYLAGRNAWTSLGRLAVGLYDDDGKTRLAHGSLSMDLVDMTRRHAAQLGMKRDTATALIAFAGYPLLFLRAILKTRLWDFRLPDYAKCRPPELTPGSECAAIPDADDDGPAPTPWPEFPRLRKSKAREQEVAPETPVTLEVPRTAGDEQTKVAVKLTRYRRREPLVPGRTGDGMIQVKSIVLVNGFAQPTLPFVAQEIPQNLAEFFYDLGYDVWLFDYRTSTILEASAHGCTMDDIASYDIPAAIDSILGTLRAELNLPADAPLQIYSFAHCVGAAVLAMSMLAGRLTYGGENGGSKVAGVVLSQFQPFVIGSKTGQIRLRLASFLSEAAGIQLLRFSAAERKPTTFESLLDRLFATLPVTDAERCPHENDRFQDRPDVATCKRMSGIISRLLKHDRIREATHRKLDVYFGRANTKLFAHGAKCVDYERLVNADGQNVYVTDRNIARYFRLPIALLHGTDNALFAFESSVLTEGQLRRVNGAFVPEKCYTLIRAEDYAHFDCTVGKGIEQNIFPALQAFLNEAWKANEAGLQKQASGVPAKNPIDCARYPELCSSRVRAPVAGPILSVRTAGGRRRLRVWIQVDEGEADAAVCAMTVLRRPGGKPIEVKTWPILRIATEEPAVLAQRLTTEFPERAAYVAIAIADFELDPADAAVKTGFDIDMVSVHEFPNAPTAPRPGSASSPEPRPGRRTIPAPGTGDHGSWPANYGTLGVDLWSGDFLKDAGSSPGIGFTLPGDGEGPGDRFDLSELAEVAPARRDARAPLIEDLKRRLDESEQVQCEIEISAEYAEELLRVLRETTEKARETALSPDPRTLSRKRRRLAELGTWKARVPRRIMEGPAPGGLHFLLGCCRYPGMEFEAVRADSALRHLNDLLESDAEHRDFMLLVGDQIYADATAGLLDVASPVEKFRLCYEQAFATREFGRLARQLPLYMAIDDHEIVDNWSQDRLAEGREAKRLFFAAMASYAAYQYSHSPRNRPGVPGFNYEFEAGGYPFVVLDTRTQRSRHGAGAPAILVQEQIDHLEQWLASWSGKGKDDGRPKFIVTGSVLFPGLRCHDVRSPGRAQRSDVAADSWQMAQGQRRRILELLRTHATRNVVFVSGDYHCAATATLDLGAGLKAYAVASPPLYAPYTYANVQAHEIMRLESIPIVPIAGGAVEVAADILEGNGFADIRVAALAGAAWSLEVVNYRLRLEDEQPAFMPVARQFVLQ